MNKTKVGILFGGRSLEHNISILSAQNIFSYIDTKKFEISLIGIDPKGDWYLCRKISKEITKGKPLTLALKASAPCLFTEEKPIPLEVIFPVLHGTNGEDGTIQGLLKTVKIPFVGADTLGSALAMDKLTTKRILENKGIPTARFLTYTKSEQDKINYNQIVATLGLPFIIKPSNLGSSLGIFKISQKKGFDEKIASLFQLGNTALIEEFIEGRELECAVLGNDSPVASPAGEIIIKDKHAFYSYEAKYEAKNTVDLVIPAKISKKIEKKIQETVIHAYKTTSCRDLARVDLFLKKDETIIINEINTIPGFTKISMYPKLIEQLGVSYKELITKLIEMAIKRHLQEAKTTPISEKRKR